MKNNPLKQLGALDQSIWLDYIRRDLIGKGGGKHDTERSPGRVGKILPQGNLRGFCPLSPPNAATYRNGCCGVFLVDGGGPRVRAIMLVAGTLL